MLDYIVIGSGPAGLLVNGEMAKANLKGICLEKGNVIKSTTKEIYSSYQILNGYKSSGFNILIGRPPLLLEGNCLEVDQQLIVHCTIELLNIFGIIG